MLPTGTVTFLFTDIQGSVTLWERTPEPMAAALQMHNTVLHQAIRANGGTVFKTVGDSVQAVFPTASQALKAAIEAQRGLLSASWNELGPLQVRMGLHTGEAELDPQSDEYKVSHTKNRVSRIMSAAHGGQILISQAVAVLLGVQLPEGVSLKDMGEHHLKGLLNTEQLYQVLGPGLAADFPPLVTGDPQSNLPLPTTPFFGRETELAQIEKMLADPENRLITLTGIGGSGKTRLAIQVARQNRLYQANVYFIALATITSLDDLVLGIAEAIQYSFQAPPGINLPIAEAQSQLLQYLANKKMLLVLDNFEQLTGWADFLASILNAAAEVRLLVTSRERLNLPGEWVLELVGLSYPGQQTRGVFLQYPAVQLFVKAAERVSHFAPTENDWPAITLICQLLEGMPLGIEMAAAWVKMLSCQEIAAEIVRNLDFLTATWRGVPERHSTLRAVFDTSWRLLPDDERQVFSRLAVFRGGFRREAASEVADASLPLLATLVDKSFVRRTASGRFEIHPILKQYATEKLDGDPSTQAEVRTRHAHYYSDWLSRMYVDLKGENQFAAMASLRVEIQNLRLAFQVLTAECDFRRLEEIFPVIILFYEMNNQRVGAQEVFQLMDDLQRQLRRQLDTTSDAGVDALLRSFYQSLLALTLAALHHFTEGYYKPQFNERFQQESLELIQDMPDSQTKAYALLLICISRTLDSDQKLEYIQECFRIFKGTGDDWGAALAQLIWADEMNFSSFDMDMARAAYQASLGTFVKAKNSWGQALCYFGTSILEQKAGHLEEAYRLGNQSLELFSQLGNDERVVWIRDVLGEIAAQRGSLSDARYHFEANLAHFINLGDADRQQYYQERLAKLNGQPPAGGM
jgi:predicted ATPase/class 3 adenylate cyclase